MIQCNFQVNLNLAFKRCLAFKNICKPIILALSLLFPSIIQAQDSGTLSFLKNLKAPDSLLFDTIDGYYDANIFAYPDAALAIAKYHVKIAREKNKPQEQIKALLAKALIHVVMEDIDLAVAEYDQTMGIAKQLNDQETIAKIHTNLGNVYLDRDLFVEALRSYNLSLPYFKNKKDYQTEGHILNNIGLIYRQISSYDKALEYFEKALKLYEKNPSYISDGNIFNNIGSIKSLQGKPHEAISNFDKAIEIFDSINNPRAKVDAYFEYAKALKEIGLKERAIQYSEAGVELSKKTQLESKLIIHKAQLANFIMEEDLQGAGKIVEEIKVLSHNDLDFRIKIDIYDLFYKYYKVKNNYRVALEMYEKFKRCSDSLQVEKDKNAFLEKAIEYEYKEQLHQNQIKFQEEQNQLKQKQTKRSFLLLLLSMFFIFSTLFVAQNRIRKQKEKRQVLLQEIDKLKIEKDTNRPLQTEGFQLDRARIEQKIGRNINETDWKVLNILLDDPVISNKSIAEKAFMSIDGIGSSLRRMYQIFEIKDSRYKKISLLMEVIKLSK